MATLSTTSSNLPATRPAASTALVKAGPDATSQSPAEDVRMGQGTEDPSLRRPDVGQARTAPPPQQPPSADPASDAQSLIDQALVHTAGNADWAQAAKTSQGLFKESQQYSQTGKMTLPSPQQAESDLQGLCSHLLDPEAAKAGPITFAGRQLMKSDMLAAAEGQTARGAVAAGHGFDAVSRQLVAAAMQEANQMPGDNMGFNVAAAVLKLGNRPVPAELRALIPPQVKEGLLKMHGGDESAAMQWGNLCPEVFMAATKVANADHGNFVQYMKGQGEARLNADLQLKAKYDQAKTAADTGMQAATLIYQNQPDKVPLLDKEHATANFVSLMNFLGKPSNAGLPPVTLRGQQLEALAEKDGKPDVVGAYGSGGGDFDARRAYGLWRSTAENYLQYGFLQMQNGRAVTDGAGNPLRTAPAKAPYSKDDILYAMASAVIDDHQRIGHLFPDVTGSAYQLLMAYNHAAEQEQQAKDPGQGFTVAH